MRTRTVIIIASSAVGLAGLGAVLAPMDDVSSLVNHVAKGVPVETTELVEVVPTTAMPSASAVSVNPAPIDTGTAPPLDDTPTAAPLHVEAPDEAAMPFVGVWTQESVTRNGRVVVELSLTDDGLYEGLASMYPPSESEHTPPSRTIGTRGAWTMRARSVVLTRAASDDPAMLPIGWREVYWDCVVTEGAWVYRDADGLERTLERIVPLAAVR